MSFGLTNTLATFIDIINTVFEPYLDMFVIIFNDDILIYLKNEEDQASHLKIALQRLNHNYLSFYSFPLPTGHLPSTYKGSCHHGAS